MLCFTLAAPRRAGSLTAALRSGVAQSVERAAVNRLVAGSSPAAGATSCRPSGRWCAADGLSAASATFSWISGIRLLHLDRSGRLHPRHDRSHGRTAPTRSLSAATWRISGTTQVQARLRPFEQRLRSTWKRQRRTRPGPGFGTRGRRRAPPSAAGTHHRPTTVGLRSSSCASRRSHRPRSRRRA